MHTSIVPVAVARRLSCASGILIASFSVTGHLAAQRATIPVVTVIDSIRADGSTVQVPLRSPKSAFDLTAASDMACAAFRGRGQLQGGAMNVRGPVPTNQGGGCIPAHIYGNRTGYVFFEMGFFMAAPPHEHRKIRAVHPGTRSMISSWGYSANWQFVTSTPNRTALDAADGQFGKNFSGVTIAFDGSCRDDADFFRESFQLMAMLDCPATWGSEGYKGKLHVPNEAFLQRFKASPETFNWNEWEIPESQLDPTRYLGNQSFYGYMSDYSREIRLRFGRVVPGGDGMPIEPGYPLGIEIRIDGWHFANPKTVNSQFYQATLVNSSKHLYGTGIDYDSLYFGMTPGFLMGGSNVHAMYFDIPRNSMHVSRQGWSGRCSGTYPRRYTLSNFGCVSATTSMSSGVYTITWLKSPLGDHRNKLFSDPTSQFYAPNHPAADDTINYRTAQYGGFGNNNIQRSTRAAFGTLAKVEQAALDGRTPAEIGAQLFLRYFTPENDITVFPQPNEVKYPKFVPSTTTNPKTGLPFGKWDYNNDGVPDTISVPGCGSRGCHELWSDTNAGGFGMLYANVFNSIGAGPFKLAAGDTTQFLWAFTWSPDTIEAIRRIDGVLDSYLKNWFGPAPIPFPAIDPGTSYDLQSAELRDSLTAGAANAATGARVVIRMPQINPIDQYFLTELDRIRRDSAENVGRTRLILRLNPGLLDRIAARTRDNLAAVYIFKSCDDGITFTTTQGVASTCVEAPTRNVDDNELPFPWRPWAIVNYTDGVPSTGTIAEDVMPGRSYVYSFVTRSRGFRDLVVIDSGPGGYVRSDVQRALGVPQDSISPAIRTSGSTVIRFYAPVTNAAGRVYARVDTATVGGAATQDLQFTNVGASIAGTTRMVFANRFIVRKTIDTVTNAATTTVSAQYVLPRAVVDPADGVTEQFVARTQSFTTNLNIPVRAGATLATGTLRGTSGSSRIYIDTIDAAASTVGFVWVTADNRPIYVTDNQYAANFERDQQSSPLYPGFTVRARDSANATTGFRQELVTSSGIVRDRRFVLRGAGDTLQPNARQFTIFVQPIVTGVKRNRGGSYRLTWAADPWGPGAPFRLDPVGTLQQRVSSSIEAATAAATTVTVTDDRIGQQVGATTARPLVRVRLPFSMTYTNAETGETHPVSFAMLARQAGIASTVGNTRLMGSGNDTLRVGVADSIWLPGDTLYAIHKVRRDSTISVDGQRITVVSPETINGVSGFRPVQVEVDSIGLSRFVVSCAPTATASGPRPSAFEQSTCNPLAIQTRGATPNGGYLPVGKGWVEYFELTNTFDARSEVALTAQPFTTSTQVTQQHLQKVNVVPNPYVVRSDMDEVNGRTANARIWFTGMPEQGTLRIYSVSGQWLQELNWSALDLTYQGNVTSTGDLPYNLKTREGYDLSSGLYLYVLTSNGHVQRGKFVIIR